MQGTTNGTNNSQINMEIQGIRDEIDSIQTDIGAAIQEKGVTVEPDVPFNEYADLVRSISTGGGGSSGGGGTGGGGSSATLGSKVITANGNYAAAADGFDGYSSVSVNVTGATITDCFIGNFIRNTNELIFTSYVKLGDHPDLSLLGINFPYTSFEVLGDYSFKIGLPDDSILEDVDAYINSLAGFLHFGNLISNNNLYGKILDNRHILQNTYMEWDYNTVIIDLEYEQLRDAVTTIGLHANNISEIEVNSEAIHIDGKTKGCCISQELTEDYENADFTVYIVAKVNASYGHGRIMEWMHSQKSYYSPSFHSDSTGTKSYASTWGNATPMSEDANNYHIYAIRGIVGNTYVKFYTDTKTTEVKCENWGKHVFLAYNDLQMGDSGADLNVKFFAIAKCAKTDNDITEDFRLLNTYYNLGINL